jgi:hypothetical protein
MVFLKISSKEENYGKTSRTNESVWLYPIPQLTPTILGAKKNSCSLSPFHPVIELGQYPGLKGKFDGFLG